MSLYGLRTFCAHIMHQHPNLKDQVIDIYRLAVDDVEDGDSEDHACELAINDLKQLVENNRGAVAERPNASALKAEGPKGSVGSNPTRPA